MDTVVVGIDPGLDGALVALVNGQPIARACWPTLALKKSGGGTKREYDEPAVVALLRKVTDGLNAHVFIEKQQAMPGQGVTSMFSTGYGYGMLRGILVALGVPWTVITAKAWQATMMAGMPHPEGKKASSQAHIVCSRLWPGLDLRASERSRTPHSGICDALLISEHGRRTLGLFVKPSGVMDVPVGEVAA
jgi:crossover junction endodeoxyribonuclease RuvC